MEVITAPITNKNRLVITTTAPVTTITIAVAKKTTSTVVITAARPGRQYLLSEIWSKRLMGIYLLALSITDML